MQHLHEKTVMIAKSIAAEIKKHRSKVDGLFKINQIMLPVKLAERSLRLSEKNLLKWWIYTDNKIKKSSKQNRGQ